ncbi:MAG: NAD(P)H-dependent oxidoreductase [Actinomycetota bacterium]|nr:NAD(P)H-dependent oxidoreductase [Actinomycetota bacterium]
MTTTTRILALAGSLRAASYNRQLLNTAITATPDNVELLAWDALKLVPPFDEDDEERPGAVVQDLRDAIAHAHALLVVTPEYNGSIPGQLKNAVDWASRPREHTVLRDKVCAVIGASPSPGGARTAQADARRILARAGAHVLDDELSLARAHHGFDADGSLTDAQLQEDLGAVVAALAHAGSLRYLPQAGEPQPVPA